MVLPYLMWMDWLHGGAEALLTLTNLFIVLGLRQALRNASGPMKKIIRSCFGNRRGEEVFHPGTLHKFG